MMQENNDQLWRGREVTTVQNDNQGVVLILLIICICYKREHIHLLLI